MNIIIIIQIRQVLLGLYIWETNLIETLTKMNANRRKLIVFAVSCSSTVTDEFELQLTKTVDKAHNWMTMFQNWSTKDETETSIRIFQSVRDEIENTFSKIEWRGDENGRENVYHREGSDPILINIVLNDLTSLTWIQWRMGPADTMNSHQMKMSASSL